MLGIGYAKGYLRSISGNFSSYSTVQRPASARSFVEIFIKVSLIRMRLERDSDNRKQAACNAVAAM